MSRGWKRSVCVVDIAGLLSYYLGLVSWEVSEPDSVETELLSEPL